MNRREFLAAAAGAAASLRTGRAAAAIRGRVVVVGAGLAGLAAAYELSRAGWRVTVLEARKVVGGRVRTVREPFSDGQYAEAGAVGFRRTHRTLLAYARRFGLGYEEPAAVGTPVTFVDRRRFRERAADAAELAKLYAAAASMRPQPGFDGVSVVSLLSFARRGSFARFSMEAAIRQAFAAEPNDLSLLFFAEQWKERSRPATLRFRGGTDRLPIAFAERLDDLRLKEPVTRIERSAAGVRVDGIDADHCVLAVPLPAFRDIEFSPPLPAALATAAKKITYGPATTTLLQYERRFWRQEGLSGSVLTDLAIGSASEATVAQRGRAGILVGYTAGANGRVYGNVGSADRELLAADELEEIFPGSRRLLAATDSSAWARERYSGGAFPAYAPGQLTRYRRELHVSLGRLVLAGEHMDALTGTMEGALSSGRRAAATITARG